MKQVLISVVAGSSCAKWAVGCLRSISMAIERQSTEFAYKVVLVDVGLTPDQKSTLADVCELRFYDATDEFNCVEAVNYSTEFYLSRILRPRLPQMFPGHDVYLALDADTWVQNADFLPDTVSCALLKGCALVPSLHHSYHGLFNKESDHYRWMIPIIRKAYGSEIADKMRFLPVFNAGMVCATSASPLWRSYQQMLTALLESGAPLRDQPALNVAVYIDSIPITTLPSTYNWLCCQSLPQWSAVRKCFVAPGAPYEPIKLLHLTHAVRKHPVLIRTTTGSSFSSELTFEHFLSLTSQAETMR